MTPVSMEDSWGHPRAKGVSDNNADSDDEVLPWGGIDAGHSPHWKNLGTVLIFHPPDFQFNGSVLIVELDYGLVKPISNTKLYDETKDASLEVYDEEFLKKLHQESKDRSIVVLSNQIKKGRLAIDLIKRKMEYIVAKAEFPMLGIFAMVPNKFMKPHTGMWSLLQTYYDVHGKRNVNKALIVSNDGGLLVEKKLRYTGPKLEKGEKRPPPKFKKIMGFADTDRAFGNNTGIPYVTIGEFLGFRDEEFAWDPTVLDPTIRAEVVKILSAVENPNPFQEIGKIKKVDTYLVFVMGPPCSGKTAFASWFVKTWTESDFGKFNKVLHLGPDMTKAAIRGQFQKNIKKRISVVIDGKCESCAMRRPFLKYISRMKNVGVLCVEVSVGLKMAGVFNHTRVQQAETDDVMLYSGKEYHYYNGIREEPRESEKLKFIKYIPKIIPSKPLMEYRY